MAKNIECRITITEADGKLVILANIPDGAEDTIACALTKALIEHSATAMNAVLGDTQTVEVVSSH